MNPFWEVSYVVEDIRWMCLDIAHDIWDFFPLLSLLGNWFYSLYSWLWDVQWWFIQAGHWYNDVKDNLADILSWSNIRSLIRSWLPDLEDAVDWFYHWWEKVISEVEDWWTETRTDVLGWIDIATEGLDTLKSEWHNFWTVTFPTLVSFSWLGEWWDTQLLGINELLDTWVVNLTPFWEGWQDVKDDVVEFITDPLQWFYDRLEEIFDRFW